MLKRLFKKKNLQTYLLEELLSEQEDDLINLKFFQSYPEYEDVLRKLSSYQMFLKKTKPTPIIITVKTNERRENVRETKLLELINSIFLNSVENSKTSFVRFSSSIGKAGYNLSDYIRTYNNDEDSFYIFEFEYIEEFMTTGEDEIEFANLIRSLLAVETVILRGTEKAVNRILNLIDRTPHLTFDMTTEVSIMEALSIIKEGLENIGIHLDKTTTEGLVELLENSKEPLTTSKLKNLSDELISLALNNGNAEVDFEELKSSKQVILDNSIFELEKMIGLNTVKRTVQSLVDYLEFNKMLEVEKNASMKINLNMLFYGSPGTGKTTVARIISKILFELGYLKKNKFVEIDAKDIVSKWVGDSALKANNVIQEARGGLLFIDEAYSLSKNDHGHESVATLIKAMSDLGEDLVVVFAGYKEEMQEFLTINPGIKSRIAYHLEFEDYSVDELVSILENSISEYNMTASNDFIEKTKLIFEDVRKNKDFGNGRFVMNYLQKVIINHSTYIKNNDVTDKFLLTANSIPSEFGLMKGDYYEKTPIY